jgi:hypothetical protein
MKLIFIDETSDHKFKDYLGLCIAITDSAHYKTIKNSFQNILRKSNWDESIEFKGSLIFSAKKGDLNIGIPERIKIAEELIDLNVAKKNARISFYYGAQRKVKDQTKAYLEAIPSFLSKNLPKAQKGASMGKDIALISCDYRHDIKIEHLQYLLESVVRAKGYTLFEKVSMSESSFHTVGLLITDIICYLEGRVDVIGNDAQLFENIPENEFHKNGKIRHLLSSKSLIEKVKNIKTYHRKI